MSAENQIEKDVIRHLLIWRSSHKTILKSNIRQSRIYSLICNAVFVPSSVDTVTESVSLGWRIVCGG